MGGWGGKQAKIKPVKYISSGHCSDQFKIMLFDTNNIKLQPTPQYQDLISLKYFEVTVYHFNGKNHIVEMSNC